jgi:hypothetical protein
MKQSDFTDLPKLSIYRYENFLNIYEDGNGTRFYNFLRSINILPANDSSAEDDYYVKINDTWVLISYRYYGTMHLWWLICEYNNVKNPTIMPEQGTKIKLLRKEFVWPVISALNSQINS